MDIGELSNKERSELYAAVLRAAYAIARRNQERAIDLTQEAFLLQASTRPWNRDGGIPLVRHLIGIVQSVWSTQAIAYVARIDREQEFVSGEAIVADGAEGQSAEVKLLALAERKDAGRLARRHLATLTEKLKKLGLALDLEIVAWMHEDVTKAEELVERTGRSAGEVKTALARIRRHLTAIVSTEGGDIDESDAMTGVEGAEGELS